jgi:hypothetical protein
MSSSLMLTEPNRFATAQRMAQAFAQSEMVPETLRGSMANCLVALMLADEMGESPLMVMQNIFFVGGRAGWMTQYMIARANRSGKFRGPLRWRSEGEGDDLAVTCFADLAAVDGDPRVEIKITMKMAHADGWTTRWDKKSQRKIPAEKYQSMPEQMLRWRSATWLIRLYAPDVMFGLPTGDELEDTMKDVTPPKPEIDDFKPSGLRSPLAAVIEHEATDGPVASPAQDPPQEFDREAEADSLSLQQSLGFSKSEADAIVNEVALSPPPPPVVAEIPTPRLNGQADYRGWRMKFHLAASACRDRGELATLIGENYRQIEQYNIAFPRLAPGFSVARTKRMEDLPDA